MSKKIEVSNIYLYNIRRKGGANMLFVPILKTKQNAEKAAFEKLLPLFNDEIIPYIQIIKKLSSFSLFEPFIKDKKFFFEIHTGVDDFIKKYEEITNKYSNAIPVMQISKIPDKKSYSSYNDWFKLLNRPFGLLLCISEFGFIDHDYISNLTEDDYLFINIDDSPYDSLKTEIDEIKEICKAKIIIISQERKDNIAGRYFASYTYNRAYFMSPVIDSIKLGLFEEDGFASYCTAKNNEEDTGGNGKPLTAAFLTYVFAENSIYVVTSEKDDIISRVYTSVRKRLTKSTPENAAFNSLYASTPISLNRLNDELKKTKHSRAVDFIEISIIHYVEEIKNNLF